MTLNQFQEVLAMNEEKIFGQFITITSVTDPIKDLLPEFKDMGIKKVSTIQTHLFKKSYLDIVNTSTGAMQAGVEFKPKKESPYTSLALNGLCSELKSNPDKKYLILKFSGEDTSTIYYVNDRGEKFDAGTILKEKYVSVRKATMESLGVKVEFRAFNIDNIYELSINKQILTDDRLDAIVSLTK
jgi:hypothetical protein